MKALKATEIKQFIVDCLKCRMIAYISGPPGIGKSDIVAQVASEFNLKLLDIRLSQMLQEDLTGIPEIDSDSAKAKYRPFDTFPLATDEIPDGYDGWLIFLDELSSASEEVMAAIYNLLLGHRVGSKRIHPKALIIAAGNRSTDSAIARPLPDTLITRMLPCEMKVSAKDWIAWAEADPGSNNSVINFIRRYDDMLISNVDPSARDELEAYPTPRGWSKVFTIMNMHERETKKTIRSDSAGIPLPSNEAPGSPLTSSVMNLINSAVGQVCAHSFQEFYNESLKIPQPWEVASSPHSTMIPGNATGKSELTFDLSKYFCQANDQTRDNLLQFMNRMDNEYKSMFTYHVKDQIGETESDKKLLTEITKRLNTTFTTKSHIRYQVFIEYHGPKKYELIQDLRSLTICSLQEAEDFVEGKSRSGVELICDSLSEAEKISKRFTDLDAQTSIKEFELLF